MGARSSRFAILVLGSLATVAPAAESIWAGPQLVSPGGRGTEGRVATGCPTFSWSLVPHATSYEVEVYAFRWSGEPSAPLGEPVLRVELPGGVTSFTPELGECLAAGRYGWAVGAVRTPPESNRATDWSKPAVFRVGFPNPSPGRAGRRSRVLEGAPVAIAPPPSQAADAAPAGAPRTIADQARFTPPGCSAGGEMFADVGANDPFCGWIEQFARDGISAGCGNNNFCPDQPVTRRQLALAIERAMRGTLTFAPAPGGPRRTTVDGAPANAGFSTSIAIGADDLPIITHWDAGDGPAPQGIWVTHCNDLTCSQATHTGVTIGIDPAIAIGADGLPVISYHLVNSLTVKHCNDVACTGSTTETVDDPGNNVGLNSSIAIGADGLPVISYLDHTAKTLVVAHCDDVACAAATITTVDDPANGNSVGGHTSIAIGADALPIISYFDETASALKVAHCSNTACTAATVNTVDENSLGSTSIAIGADGLPIISHRGPVPALQVVHCNDVACAGANETITTVDAAGNVGSDSSITIGVDGLPVISYYDFTAFALKVAHCNDAACAGAATTRVDDPANNVGQDTSIAIGADGVPVISYHDVTAGDLKVVHCGTVSCRQ